MKIERLTPVIKVVLSEHAEARWLERAGRMPGGLKKLLAVKLRDNLRAGLIIHHGRAMVWLNKEDLNIPVTLVACLDLPNESGIWRVITFKEVIG